MADVVSMLARRCAWCQRVFTANGWTAPAPGTPAAPEGETDTLCPDCARRPQQRR